MAIWNTIHVFGYGESQMIGAAKNGAAQNETLTTLSPLISYLATLQQEGTTISMEKLYALNMFNSMFVDFLPNSDSDNKAQRFAVADIDGSYIDNLATELSNLIA